MLSFLEKQNNKKKKNTPKKKNPTNTKAAFRFQPRYLPLKEFVTFKDRHPVVGRFQKLEESYPKGKNSLI